MNSMILGLFTSIETVLKMIILIIVLVGIISLCVRIPQLIPVIGGVLAIAIMVTGGLATIQCSTYFSTHNVTLGEVIKSSFNNSSTAEEVEGKSLSWNLTNIGFEYQGNTTYLTTIEKPFNEAIDLVNNNYVLYINNNACEVNETGTDYVKSQYVYSFYDRNNNLILRDTLYINFGFYSTQTIIEISTESGEIAVDMWKAYQVKNGFRFELKGQTKQEISATKLRTATRTELVENTSDEIFTINCYVNKSLDYLSGRQHSSTDYKLIQCTRIDAALGSPYHIGTTLIQYFKSADDNYNLYSGNYHSSTYQFLDFGDTYRNYTNEQRANMQNIYTMTSQTGNPNVLDILLYSTTVDLTEYQGINPTGMILNIYIDLVTME